VHRELDTQLQRPGDAAARSALLSESVLLSSSVLYAGHYACAFRETYRHVLMICCAHRELDLRDNALVVLPPGIFDPLPNLVYVPLSPITVHVLLLGQQYMRKWRAC